MPKGKDVPNSIEQLKGVGPKISESLKQLGIHNIQDALFHLPYRYEDRTKITPLGEAGYESPVLIEGEIIKSTVVFRGRRMLFTEIYDGTGRLTIRMFHFAMAQHKALKQGLKSAGLSIGMMISTERAYSISFSYIDIKFTPC